MHDDSDLPKIKFSYEILLNNSLVLTGCEDVIGNAGQLILRQKNQCGYRVQGHLMTLVMLLHRITSQWASKLETVNKINRLTGHKQDVYSYLKHKRRYNRLRNLQIINGLTSHKIIIIQ